MAVYLLTQLYNQSNPMAQITPQALASASNCYTACMSGKGLLGAIVYLLCQIDSGGGGIGGNFRAGSGVPVGPNPGLPRTAYEDDLTGVIYVQNLDGTWPTVP